MGFLAAFYVYVQNVIEISCAKSETSVMLTAGLKEREQQWHLNFCTQYWLTLTVPDLVNPIDLLHIYMPMVMRGLMNLWMLMQYTQRIEHQSVTSSKIFFQHFHDFYASDPRRAPEALCFRVVRPYENLFNTKSQEPLGGFFYHTWPRGAPWRVDELIRIWARSAQGQRSKVGVMDCNCEGYRKDRGDVGGIPIDCAQSN